MNRSYITASVSLLIIGSILRLAFFWQPSFTGDESAHMMKAISVAKGLSDFVLNRNHKVAVQNILRPILEHNHPPLEFLVLIPSVPFHPREFYARFVYILISVLTLIVGFITVYKIRGKLVALSFLAFFSTSSFLIWFSQMVTFGLNLTSSILITIALLTFVSKPTQKSLLFMVLATAFSLYVSVDFLLFLPVVGLAIISRRKFFAWFDLTITILIGVFLIALFYVPYVGYSFLPNSPQAAGFIHYKSYLTSTRSDQVRSHFKLGIKTLVNEKWNQFLSRPGVLTLWPWALLSLILLRNKKIPHIRYLWFCALLIIIFEIPLIPCCTVYLNIYGPLLLLAAEGIAIFPRFTFRLITIITVIQIVQSLPLLQGIPNQITFSGWQKSEDRIKEIGVLVKPCLIDDQTYISTEDAWRTRYYFGRPMLASVEYELISRETAVKQFLHGDLPQITIIHIHTPQFSEDLLTRLKKQALNYRDFGNHSVFFFKKCVNN